MYNAEVKNVNFVNVSYLGKYPSGTKGYNNNQQYGQYFGLFAHVAHSNTFTDINVQITQMQHNNWNLGLFAYKVDGTSTYTNINVDATGVMLKNVLATNHSASNEVYSNVTLTAAGYTTIASGNTSITEWPTGITYTQNATPTAVRLNDNATTMAYYTGDETALGFADGTAVQYLETTDEYTGAYDKAGPFKAVIPAKADGTATFQMVLSLDLAGGYLFHVWGVVGTSNSTSYAQVKSNGSAVTYEGFTMSITDVNGNAVSGDLKANTIYNVTMVAANDPAKGNETGFRIGVLALPAVTLYFANVNA